MSLQHLSRNSHSRRRTFPPDTENVLRRVHVPIMGRAAARTLPMSYSKILSAFRTADASAIGTGLGSPSFVGLNISRPVPNGFIAELVAERRPTGIENGLRHPRLSQLGSVHIANDDQTIFSGNSRRVFVKMMFSSVRDLGVDCLHASGISRSPGFPKVGFVSAVVLQRGDNNAVAARRQGLQAKVDSYLAGSGCPVLRDLADHIQIPPALCILSKRAGFNFPFNRPVKPKSELLLENGNGVAFDVKCPAVVERNPAQGFLAAPSRALPMLVSAFGKLCADRINNIAMQAKLSTTTRCELVKIEGARPSATPAPRLFLNIATIVPDEVNRPRHTVETLADRGVFHSIFEGQKHTGIIKVFA